MLQLKSMKDLFKILIIFFMLFSSFTSYSEAKEGIFLDTNISHEPEEIILDVPEDELFDEFELNSSQIRETEEDIKEFHQEYLLDDDSLSTKLLKRKYEEQDNKIFEGNIEQEYSFFEDFNKYQKPQKTLEEKTLFAQIIAQDIVRTDIPSYLLRDYLTVFPERGMMEKIQFYTAYRGYLTSEFAGSDYSTNYDIGTFDIGLLGKFRNSETDFKAVIKPLSNKNVSYMKGFFGDIYLKNSTIPRHQIILGYSRNIIGKEGSISSQILPFVTRSQISRNFGNTRGLGVKVLGHYDLVDYSVEFKSADRYFQRWFNAGPEFTGWVDLKPFGKTDGRYGKLVIGGGYNTGHNVINYNVGSLYLGYKYKKLWSSFEYSIADGYNGVKPVDKKASGFYATVGYKFTPQFQLIGRYDRFDPNRDISGDIRTEYTAGINYFIKGQALRLILNYVFCQNENAQDSHRIMIGTQMFL